MQDAINRLAYLLRDLITVFGGQDNCRQGGAGGVAQGFVDFGARYSGVKVLVNK